MPAGKYLFYGEKMELKTLLKIDSVLEQPVLLAPMAGVTDYAFREICRRQGADMTYSEMISAKGLKYNSRRTFELADVHQGERLAIQLFGREPKDIAVSYTHLIKKVVLGGGVSANAALRARALQQENYQVYLPDLRYCTDNGAMIASAAYYSMKKGCAAAGLALNAEPGLELI